MKMFKRKKIALLLIVTIILSLSPVSNINAAAKPKINKKSVTMYVGKTVQLKIKNNKKKIKWSSSNKDVATVNRKGKVKAVEAGKATITAKIGKNKYKCKITIKNYNNPEDKPQTTSTTEEKTPKNQNVSVTGITLNESIVFMKEGDIEYLKATVAPENATNKEVIWRSRGSSIVEVNEKGCIKGVKVGDAYIEARTKDGDFIQECRVHVEPNVKFTTSENSGLIDITVYNNGSGTLEMKSVKVGTNEIYTGHYNVSLRLVRNRNGNYGYAYSYTYERDYISEVVNAYKNQKFSYGKSTPTYYEQGDLVVNYTYNGNLYTRTLQRAGK